MWYDLQTLLALWIGVDVVVALAFAAQQRRLPGLSGPGWWALMALAHMAAALALVLRPFMPPVIGLPLSNVLLSAPFAFMWLGFRAYKGQPLAAPAVGLALGAGA